MKPFVRILFTCSLIIGTTLGCTPNSTGVVSATAPVSKADIAALEVSLTEAISVANTCLAQTVGPCVTPATRATVIADVHTAHDAFKKVQADNNAGLPVVLTAVNLAMSKLTSDTPAIPSGK